MKMEGFVGKEEIMDEDDVDLMMDLCDNPAQTDLQRSGGFQPLVDDQQLLVGDQYVSIVSSGVDEGANASIDQVTNVTQIQRNISLIKSVNACMVVVGETCENDADEDSKEEVLKEIARQQKEPILDDTTLHSKDDVLKQIAQQHKECDLQEIVQQTCTDKHSSDFTAIKQYYVTDASTQRVVPVERIGGTQKVLIAKTTDISGAVGTSLSDPVQDQVNVNADSLPLSCSVEEAQQGTSSEEKAPKVKGSPKRRGRRQRTSSATGSDNQSLQTPRQDPSASSVSPVRGESSHGDGSSPDLGFKPSLLEEVLNEKKLALMRSPEVIRYLQSRQAQLARLKQIHGGTGDSS